MRCEIGFCWIKVEQPKVFGFEIIKALSEYVATCYAEYRCKADPGLMLEHIFLFLLSSKKEHCEQCSQYPLIQLTSRELAT